MFSTFSTSGLVCVMSEPSHLQLRWQWLLVADEAWWVQAAGGKLSVIPKVGFNPTVCEAVYLKYMDNVPGLMVSAVKCFGWCGRTLSVAPGKVPMMTFHQGNASTVIGR